MPRFVSLLPIGQQWHGSRFRLDQVIVMDEQHLLQLLREYVDDYNTERVHTVLRDAPKGRPVEERPSPTARIIARPRIGGLHHRYEWQSAA